MALAMKRSATGLVLLAGFCLPSPAAAQVRATTASLRYCGEAQRMIANSVHASYGVRCSTARAMIKDLLGGSQACYPHGYTSHPSCRLFGFYCSAHEDAASGASVGRCVRGRLVVTGRAGP
jgi:hypothetical protein